MPHFFLKIQYLIKHESSSALIFKFIQFQLSKPFHNFLRSKNKRVFNKFITKKKLLIISFQLIVTIGKKI